MDLAVKDAAELFHVSEDTIYQWVEARGLPACRIHNKLRLNREELLEWATVTGTRVSADFLRQSGIETIVLPSLADALNDGGIYHGVRGSDKEAVLRSVVSLLKLPPQVDRPFLLEVLLAREALGSTGVGEGIAIPHPRNPIILNVDRPSLTLAFLEKPVDFGAVDGIPVQVLLMLICPTVRMHLHLLSRLAYMLHDPGFKNALQRKAPVDEILAEVRRAERILGRPND